MPIDVLNVNIDTVETRIAQTNMVMLRDGRQWDTRGSAGILVEPETLTAMLMPLPFTREWDTTGTGVYTRLKMSDYILTPASWAEHDVRCVGDTYLNFVGSSREVVKTLTRYDANRAFFVSYFGYSSGSEKYKALEVGWGDYSATASERDVQLRFWSDGNFEVWRGDTQLGDGSFVDKNKENWADTQDGEESGSTGATNTDPGVPKKQVNNERVDLVLIPCRKRELLILSNYGSACFVFDDINEQETSPVITRQGGFYWYSPEGAAQVSCAACNFKTSGGIVSFPYMYGNPPAVGEVATAKAYYDKPGYGTTSVSAFIIQKDAVAAFVPDGIEASARLYLTLTGDGASTPFVYAASAEYPAQTDLTVNDPTDLSTYIRKATLDANDGGADTKFTMTLMRPQGLHDGGCSNIALVGNRPIEAKIGSVAFFTGRTKHPKRVRRLDDWSSVLEIECQDRWRAFETYTVMEQTPLDGMQLHDAFKYIAMLPGYSSSEMDIEQFDIRIEPMVGTSRGEWTALMEVGDKASEWISRLQDDYCANTLIGWRPTVAGTRFQVASLATLDAADPVVYLSDGQEYDLALEEPVPRGGWDLWYRSFEAQSLEPEANYIAVTWRDPRTRKRSTVIDWDAASIDATTAVAARPLNWLGEPRKYAMVDPKTIRSLGAAQWASRTMMNRLSVARKTAEWKCNFLVKPDGVPVWKGDIVALYGEGKYRVTSLSAEYVLEAAAEGVWRPASYTGEYVGEIEVEEPS